MIKEGGTRLESSVLSQFMRGTRLRKVSYGEQIEVEISYSRFGLFYIFTVFY